jgi:hypothetical protein
VIHTNFNESEGLKMSLYTSYNSLQLKYEALVIQMKRYESVEEYNKLTKKVRELSNKVSVYKISNKKLRDSNKQLTRKNKIYKSDSNDFSNLNKELLKNNNALKTKINKLEIYYLKNQIVLDKKLVASKDIIDEKSIEIKALQTELKNIKDQNKKMTAQVNRDYTNSSLPSSQKMGRKKICNSRVKTGKKPGGQNGHKGHSRRTYLNVDRIVKVPRPDIYSDEAIFKETGNVITKQVADIFIGSHITEYQFMEYLNTQTGETVHAPIPKNLHNEISYGKNIKALAVMLNSDANVSVDKTIEIINEISNQEIKISKGFVNNLNGKIAKVCESELDEIFINLQRYKYMHIDATNVRVNGKNVNVFVTANPNDTLFYARESKGKKGVFGTAAQDYGQLLIHDHDRTFYNYGLNHQECLAHILRYLQSAIENEENLTWHKKMQSLLREMIASVKAASLNTLSKAAYLVAYESILELSIQEYDVNPPSKCYREGFNLAKRLKAYQDSTLYFLEDEEVPYTNNLAERQLRKVKRKARVAGSFRSFEGLEYYCNVQSIIENTKTTGKSFFEHLQNVFSLEIGFN